VKSNNLKSWVKIDLLNCDFDLKSY